MKKTWVKIVIACVVFAAVCFLSFWVGTLHSKNSVEVYKDQLRAAGEKLEISELIPPQPAPASNSVEFFLHAKTALVSRPGVVWYDTPPSAMRIVAPGTAMVGSQQPEIRGHSLTAGGLITNTWADLDASLEADSEAIEWLHRIPERPQLDFQLDYSHGFEILLPHLTELKHSALLLSTTAMSDLHRGDTASAVTNIHAAVATINEWNEPIVISQLVRIAMAQIAVGGQWELLQATNSTDQQLAMLQRDWTDLDFVSAMEHALEMERAFAISTIGQSRRSNNLAALGLAIPSMSGTASGNWFDSLKNMGVAAKHEAAFILWKSSWSYGDELVLLKGDQVLLESVRQIETNGFFSDGLKEQERKLNLLGLNKTQNSWLRNQLEFPPFGVSVVTSLKKIIPKVLAIEVSRNIAITAIALKRYQLRHGHFPESLDILVPEFLPAVPRDPVDGKPLRYRLEADGAFILYSIGEDGVDNGGDATVGKSNNWLRGRDWVWPRPATPEEVQDYYDQPPN